MTQNKNALFIMGSTRAGRKCPQVTAWVIDIAQRCTEFSCEIVDLAAWPLPMDDEAEIPAKGPYAQAHTRAWSAKIESAAAVVFVTPQYNWGYPAVLKNAIDHLYHEWRNKPVVIVTYGGHGGGKCAEQLRQVTGALKMRLAPTMPGIVLPDVVIRENAALEPERDFQVSVPAIETAFGELAELVRASSSA